MDFFGIPKEEAEKRILETPLHGEDQTDESDTFESDDEI